MVIPNKKYKTIFKPLNKIIPHKPPFRLMAPLTTDSNQPDLFEAMTQVTPVSQVLFLEIRKTYNDTYGICSYQIPQSMQNNQSTAYKLFSRHVAPLSKANIIRRLPKEIKTRLKLVQKEFIHFIVNPQFVPCDKQTCALAMWHQLAK
jgi:hypothetical protein